MASTLAQPDCKAVTAEMRFAKTFALGCLQGILGTRNTAERVLVADCDFCKIRNHFAHTLKAVLDPSCSVKADSSNAVKSDEEFRRRKGRIPEPRSTGQWLAASTTRTDWDKLLIKFTIARLAQDRSDFATLIDMPNEHRWPTAVRGIPECRQTARMRVTNYNNGTTKFGGPLMQGDWQRQLRPGMLGRPIMELTSLVDEQKARTQGEAESDAIVVVAPDSVPTSVDFLSRWNMVATEQLWQLLSCRSPIALWGNGGNCSILDHTEELPSRSPPAFESMTEDELIHKGIACVQEASVTKEKFRRERQLKKAKAMLMEALQRQRQRMATDNGDHVATPREGDAVTVHLAAVLLSLGEDPDDVRKMLGMSTPRKGTAANALQTMSTVDSSTGTILPSPECCCPTPATTATASPNGGKRDEHSRRVVSVKLLEDEEQLESEKRDILHTQSVVLLGVNDATFFFKHSVQNPTPEELKCTAGWLVGPPPAAGAPIRAVGSEVSYEPQESPPTSPPLPNCAPDVLLKYHTLMQSCPSPAAFSPVPSRPGSESDSLQIWVDQRRGSHRSESIDETPCGWYGEDDDSGIDQDDSASAIEFDPDNDEPLSDEKCDELLSEIVSQAGSSIGYSPASSVGSDWQSADFDPLLLDNSDKSLSVFLHSGITGELMSKFDIPLRSESSIDQLYDDLEDALQQNCGLGLSETHWVRDNQKIRCDKRMLVSALSPTGQCQLRMCTVPKTPPAEMDVYTGGSQGAGIRLKSLAPHSVSPGRLATLVSTPLRRSLDYAVVLVSQMDSGNSCWLSGKALFIDHKEGVIQFTLTEAQVKSLLRRTQDGLPRRVYLVVDGSPARENRRTACGGSRTQVSSRIARSR
ncbi:hypothetical protein FOZ60_006067 [Perkinsus olseni]|uniref:Uncharacterized protein n=1 Tax=Perkinsus olseni TaxID=32597 RepID=A0A7J6NS05_PEROL|nr:hypothetical protein FOZ60_006067 [Perkinsus olseni]